jgi:hypothetical protein
MVDKRFSTCVVLLVLCLSLPFLRLQAAPLDSPALLAATRRGDGFADLAVGVPGEDVGDSAADAGAVNVLYAGPDGIRIDYNQMWYEDNLPGDSESEVFDAFGSALAAGDFDGDGFDDLAIGVPYEDVGTVADAGAVNILYGSGAGLTAAGDQILYQGAGLLGEPGELDLFGYALAAGRLGDGNCEDLAIGVRNEDVDGVSSAGAVNVVYGSPAGLAAAGNQLFDQGSLLAGVPEAYDFFGSALAIGDFNRDKYGDLAVGVPREDVGGKADAGAVNVIFGTSGGLSASGNVVWTEDDVATGLSQAGDQAGYALAAGDIDGDGADDLVIGVPYQDIGTAVDAGAFDILYSYPYWPGPGVVGWSQDGPVLGQSELNDHFGMALAIGDWRGFRTYLPLAIRQG